MDMNRNMDMKREMVKAGEEVMGRSVTNMQGEDLGSVKEILMDKNSGKAIFMVVKFGDWWGIGGKLFALPWEIFSYDDGKFMISADKEMLSSLEGFDEKHWPETSNEAWKTSIYRHFGLTPMSGRAHQDRDMMQ